MKKYILAITLALLAGLLLGYWLFGGDQAENNSTEHVHTPEGNSEGEAETWTCSMHPQIRQPDPGDCPICGMDLTPLETSSSNDPTVLEMTEAAVALANIQTTTVGNQGQGEAAMIRLSGRVKADERLTASQVAHVPGRVERLYVSFTGESVISGQKLADIYSPDLISAQQELIEAVNLREISPSLLEAARNKLRYWKIDDAFITRVEQEKTIQEVFTLRADATGIVTERKIAVGDYVQRGEPLFKLVNLRKVWVLFDVYEDELANVRPGDRIEFTTPALAGRTFSARVTFIDPLIDPNTRTASVRTEVNNSSGRLKPEMLVYGELANSPERNAEALLYVPKSAVLWTGKRSVVYVQLEEATVPSYQYREVVLGEAVGDNYLVMSGLEPGEAVVTYGNFTIDAAAQLNNQFSMMNRDVAVSGVKAVAEITPNFREETPELFREQLGRLVESYLLVKDAFVESAPVKVTTAAKQLLPILETIDMALLTGDAHHYWMEQQTAIQTHGAKLAELTDMEVQREQFNFLSTALINALKSFGVSGSTVYVQHCPMAFDDEGADWLAIEEQINNPYFGEAMLRCGIIEETFVP